MIDLFVFLFVPERGADKTEEERVRTVRAALELGVKLHADIEIVPGDFDGFDDVIIRRGAADDQPGVDETCAEIVVEFIAMTVALRNVCLAVATVHLCARHDLAGVRTEPERAALGDLFVLVG